MADSYTEDREVPTTVTETVLRLDSEEADALQTLLGQSQFTGFDSPLARVYEALKSEPPAEPAPLAVGDRVRVVSEWSHTRGSMAGKTGVLVREDPYDRQLRYLVRLDNGEDGEDWAHAVERIGEAP